MVFEEKELGWTMNWDLRNIPKKIYTSVRPYQKYAQSVWAKIRVTKLVNVLAKLENPEILKLPNLPILMFRRRG